MKPSLIYHVVEVIHEGFVGLTIMGAQEVSSIILQVSTWDYVVALNVTLLFFLSSSSPPYLPYPIPHGMCVVGPHHLGH